MGAGISSGVSSRTEAIATLMGEIRNVASAKEFEGVVSQMGVRPHERVTAVADAAGEFETALGESQYVSLRSVDWFHIAMKFRAAQMSASGLREKLPENWEGISLRLERANTSLLSAVP